MIAKDVVTPADEERYVQEHLEEEERLEGRLGRSYMADEAKAPPQDHEGSQSLDQSIMDDFMGEIKRNKAARQGGRKVLKYQ